VHLFKKRALTSSTNAEHGFEDHSSRPISTAGTKVGNNTDSQVIWQQFSIRPREIRCKRSMIPQRHSNFQHCCGNLIS